VRGTAQEKRHNNGAVANLACGCCLEDHWFSTQQQRVFSHQRRTDSDEGKVMYDIQARMVFLVNLVLLLFPLSALAEVDCTILPHWVTLNNGLQMNQKHVFCGEWKDNRPKGFHSRPGGVNPITVQGFIVQDLPNAAGIYTGKWSVKSHPGKSKFSSMFPDNCSTGQVLNSISYASAHPELNCPEGSPSWAKCGKNRPDSDTKEKLSSYCTNNQEFFLIGFAAPANNKINTAFPIRE